MKIDKDLPIEPLVVDVRTAALLLNVCERTIRNLTKQGDLPVVRIASRVLYSREDLADFIRQRTKRRSDGLNDRSNSA